MKKCIAVALVAVGTLAVSTAATLAQGYGYSGAPAAYPYGPTYAAPGYAYQPGYRYAPAYAGRIYDYAPGYGYGSDDESGNSVRQPNPHSTIRAVR